MGRFILCLTVVIIAGCSGSGTDLDQQAQLTTSSTDTSEEVVSIPFTLTEFNNVSVPAIINGTEKVNLMFHTGVSDMSLTRDATSRMSNIDFDQTADVESWGGKSSARFNTKSLIQIGSFSWDDMMITECELSGRLTDGKFGPNLFDGKIIEVDFENELLKIHSFLPNLDETHEEFEISVRQGSMFISGRLEIDGVLIENEFLVHSGYSGAVLLDDEFASEHNIDAKLDVISEQELKDSYGNVMKTKKALVPKFHLGKTTFTNLPIGFFSGAIGRQKMSMLGTDVLKRFNLFIDLENSRLYLRPNSLMNSAYDT